MIKESAPIRLPCPKCGKVNIYYGKEEDLLFCKYDCGKILFDDLFTPKTSSVYPNPFELQKDKKSINLPGI